MTTKIAQSRDFPVATALSVGLSVDGRTMFVVADTQAHGRRAVLLAESTLSKLLEHAGGALRGLKASAPGRLAQGDRPAPEAADGAPAGPHRIAADRISPDMIAESAGGGHFAHYADWEDAPTVLVNEVTVEPHGGTLLLAFAGTRQTFGRGPAHDGEPAFKLLLDRTAALRLFGLMGTRARDAGLINQTAAGWLFDMTPAAPTWVH